jgi:Arylsulfotransferase (ASST)
MVSVAVRLAVFLACSLALLTPAVASAEVGLSATPALYPAFNTAVHDYIARCTGAPVQVSVTGEADRRVGVDGDAPRSGSFTRDVALAGSQSFTVALTDGGGTSLGSYRVRCLPANFPGFTSSRTGATQASWYIVTPSQSFTEPPPGTSRQYTAIFDSEGVPAWWFASPTAAPVDAKLLPNGNLAWSLATGGMEERTVGGQLVRSLNTYPFSSDIHDLVLLPNGHYLLMAYVPKSGFDLTPIGGAGSATIVDAVIQEIDPTQTGAGSVVWEWKASDHIDAAQVAQRWRAVVQLPSQFGTNDIYHINSFEPYGNGYIVSFRALDAVYYIDKTTGDIVWKLGGTNLPGKSLTVIGDPKVDPAGPLAGQHDARLLPNGDITIHDNGGYFDNGQYLGPPPRAVQYDIDDAAKTATWVAQVTDSLAPASLCCGSTRRLAGGNWVMSWGGNPLVTELTPDGSRVFKLLFDSPMFSYRAVPVTSGELTSQALQAGMDAQHPRAGLTLSGTTGAFGGVTVGTQSAARTFTVTNSGQGPVQISTTDLTGSDAEQYSISGCSAQTLAAGGSCSAAVRFTPMSTGAHDAATLRVTSNAASGPNVAPLTGTGVAAVSPPPPSTIVEPPSNAFTFPTLKVSKKNGTVTTRVKLPGPGKLAALETMKKHSAAARAALKPRNGEVTVARTTKTVTQAGKVTIRLRLNARGRRAVRDHSGRLRVNVRLRFKPTNGRSRTKSKTFTIKVPGL